MEILAEGLIYSFILFTVWALIQWSQVWRTTRGVDDLGDVQGEIRILQDLAEEKARLLNDIKELDFDFQVGHLSAQDHANLRKRLERRAIRVMKKLDQLRGEIDYDARIDAGLEQRFGIVLDDSDDMVAPPKALPSASEDATEACGECGWMMEANARFCSQCGAAMQTAPPSSTTAHEEPSSSDNVSSAAIPAAS